MRIVWMTCADADQVDRRTSLYNVFGTTFYVDEFPLRVHVPAIAIVQGREEDYTVSGRVLGPDNEVVMTLRPMRLENRPLTPDLHPEGWEWQGLVRLDVIVPADGPGTYVVEARLDEQVPATLPIRILLEQ